MSQPPSHKPETDPVSTYIHSLKIKQKEKNANHGPIETLYSTNLTAVVLDAKKNPLAAVERIYETAEERSNNRKN